jgi:hypothetical protein
VRVSVTTQSIIDQTLRLVRSDVTRLESRLCPETQSVPTLAELRAGPLGRDLVRLASVAEGRITLPRDEVFAAVEAVLQLLFWPAGADEYTVPRTFWETDLGRLLARAKYHACTEVDLIGIGVAATRFGVSRPTIYRWIADSWLESVYEPVSGRTFVISTWPDPRRRPPAAVSSLEVPRDLAAAP